MGKSLTAISFSGASRYVTICEDLLGESDSEDSLHQHPLMCKLGLHHACLLACRLDRSADSLAEDNRCWLGTQ